MNRKKIKFAFDRESMRSIDADGRMRIAKTPISKANICPYRGNEIPDAESLGLDPGKVYFLYRDPDELSKAAASFNNIQLLIEHEAVHADDPKHHLVVGSTGSHCVFENPYLFNSLAVWDSLAINAIETEEQKELSASYRYRADMTPGEVNGVKYDGVMRDIIGNHVALVVKGRAGPDVYAADQHLSKPLEPSNMKTSEMRGALKAFLTPKLAKDQKLGDLRPLLSQVNKLNFSPKEFAKTVKERFDSKLAKDTAIEMDEVIQLIAAVQNQDVLEGEDYDNDGVTMDDEDMPAVEPEATSDDMSDEQIIELLSGKVSPAKLTAIRACLNPTAQDEKDEKEKPSMNKEATKTAMDAAIKLEANKVRAEVLKEQKDIREAEKLVHPFVGEVVAMDSAEAIYRFALEAQGVDLTGVHASAFKPILKTLQHPNAARATPRVANDSQSLSVHEQLFPNAHTPKRG